MNNFTKVAIGIGEFLDLLWKTLKSIKSFSKNVDKFLFQVFDMGNRTLPVAALISLSIGSVLALQTGIQLSGYGIEDKIGGIVGVFNVLVVPFFESHITRSVNVPPTSIPIG